jgi:hypothetical protein
MLLTGYTASVSLGGVKADTVSVDSATQVTATWTKGVPVLSTPTSPVLSFTHDTSSHVHNAATSEVVTNIVSVSGSSPSLSCSFAGGCLYEVSASGLASQLKHNPEENFVSVCGKKCEYDDAASSDSIAACRVPPVSTLYSDTTFGIQSSRALYGFVTGSSGQIDKAFDKDLSTINEDYAANCYVAVEFKTGHVGVLDKVKYYLPSKVGKDAYTDFLVF